MPYSGCNRICSNELHDGRQYEKEDGRVPDALEEMSSEAVEYVRGIPVVKTFGQSVFSFKRFRDSIKNMRNGQYPTQRI